MAVTEQHLPEIRFDNSFFRQMPGYYVSQLAQPVPAPQLMLFNEALARRLGIQRNGASDDVLAAIFSGVRVPAGAEPLAQVYAGHQFGGFSPRLGDGRALLLGEVVAPDGARFDMQLKGSGPTPFSRGGDGQAAVGPVLREFLVSEAMAALGVPTSRALAAVATGAPVLRDNGVLPGAVLTRVAASHLRIGTFQYFAARGETDRLRQLADYAIDRHYPALGTDGRYLAFFTAVMTAQALLVARWMTLGFIHGVMNTDNMTISGETIDYGPCAFMDSYDPDQVFSSIDTGGRYRFANQPLIAQWNLARFAETLIGLVDADAERAVVRLTEVLERFPALYETEWLSLMREKLGLSATDPTDADLCRDLLALMAKGEADFTLAFRHLSDVVRGDAAGFRSLFGNDAPVEDWLSRYTARHARESAPATLRATAMDRVNPLCIPRNHLVEAALEQAEGQGDLSRVTALAAALADPFTERPGLEAFAAPSPGHDRHYRTFCGT